MKEAILLTDGYKLDHRRQYPENTEYVYSNWTPRNCHYYPEATEGAVVFGIQYFIKEYLMKQFQQDFFNKPKEDELETFRRLITEIYPTGFVSIVSDTWDFWKVMTEYLPKLKDEILARDGRLVIRPDSGDPVHIIAGYKQGDFENWQEQTEAQNKMGSTAVWVGAYEVLWGIFGGTINEKGYKVLNPKVGIIYGDSITLERQKEIYKRLEERGFAATNLVLGVGSYTYQYKSRDSLGFAMKATWCQVNGEGREIFKDPKTDDGTKKSLKGLICVQSDGDRYIAEDQVTKEQEDKSCLQTVFEDGKLVKEWSLRQIRDNVNNSIVLED